MNVNETDPVPEWAWKMALEAAYEDGGYLKVDTVARALARVDREAFIRGADAYVKLRDFTPGGGVFAYDDGPTAKDDWGIAQTDPRFQPKETP